MGDSVRIDGFVDNMPELMSASDLLVTKAGPGTLAEAFIAGLPVIIFGYTPGQETANVDYVLDHHAGALRRNRPRSRASRESGSSPTTRSGSAWWPTLPGLPARMRRWTLLGSSTRCSTWGRLCIQAPAICRGWRPGSRIDRVWACLSMVIGCPDVVKEKRMSHRERCGCRGTPLGTTGRSRPASCPSVRHGEENG